MAQERVIFNEKPFHSISMDFSSYIKRIKTIKITHPGWSNGWTNKAPGNDSSSVLCFLKVLVVDPPRFTSFLNQYFSSCMSKILQVLLVRESMRILERKNGDKDVTECNSYFEWLNIVGREIWPIG